MRNSTFLLVAILGAATVACTPAPDPQPGNAVDALTVEILATYPFDDSSFTQGLEVEPDGTILVGTGLEGQSRIYRRDIHGNELVSHALDDHFFGEGITRWDDTVWQLTWLSGVAIERDAQTLAEIGRVEYEGEGWGICAFADELIMSDGTDQLRRLDPETFEERERFTVTLNGQPYDQINELECVDDHVYANVFTSTDIVRIQAATGEIDAVIDASGVPNNAAPGANNVLNGIAHIPQSDRFYLTGKMWPDLYEVRFVEPETGND